MLHDYILSWGSSEPINLARDADNDMYATHRNES